MVNEIVISINGFYITPCFSVVMSCEKKLDEVIGFGSYVLKVIDG